MPPAPHPSPVPHPHSAPNPGPAPTPTPLPRRLADPWLVVAIGTLAWLTGAVVFFIASWPAVWVWTCLAGSGLGLVGFAVMTLQRNAARRGSKVAQRGLL